MPFMTWTEQHNTYIAGSAIIDLTPVKHTNEMYVVCEKLKIKGVIKGLVDAWKRVQLFSCLHLVKIEKGKMWREGV